MPSEQVVTLQFGTYANYVGAHYWNLQDEAEFSPGVDPTVEPVVVPFEHGVLHRAGIDDRGASTLTPRCVTVDALGKTGSIGTHGGLAYDGRSLQDTDPSESVAAASWGGPVHKIVADPEPASSFVDAMARLGVDDDPFAAAALAQEDSALHGGFGGGGGGGGGVEEDEDDEEDVDEDELSYAERMVLRHDREVRRQAREEAREKARGNADGRDADGGDADGGDTDAEDPLVDAARELDGSVYSWSDYLKVQFHPRSILVVNTPLLTSDPGSVFDSFAAGSSALRGSGGGGARDVVEDVEDRVRRYAEECSRVTGFQFLADADTGFAALSAACMANVRDDFGKTPILYFPIEPPVSAHRSLGLQARREDNASRDRLRSALSAALALHESLPRAARAHAIPVSFEPVDIAALSAGALAPRPAAAWHSAAVAAAAIDAATGCFRLRPGAGGSSVRAGAADFVAALSPVPAMSISRLDATLPCDLPAHTSASAVLGPGAHVARVRRSLGGSLPLSAFAGRGQRAWSGAKTGSEKIFGCAIGSRGAVSCERDLRPEREPRDRGMPRGDTPREVLEHHVGAVCSASGSSLVWHVDAPMRVPLPFPPIFDARFATSASMPDSPREGDRAGGDTVHEAAVLASATTSAEVGTAVSDLAEIARRADPRLFPAFIEQDYDRDFFVELAEDLECVADAYADDSGNALF